MSLILEALRKSEAERRRGQAPDVLADMPAAQPTARRTIPVWGWIMPVIVIMLATIWWWQRDAKPSPPSGVADTATTPARQPPMAALPPVPRLTPTLDVPAQQAVAAVSPAANDRTQAALDQSSATPQDAPQPQVPTRAAAVQPESTQAATAPAMPMTLPPAPTTTMPAPSSEPVVASKPEPAGDRIESLSDLSTTDRQALPPLKLSMHLWNADPARRFVILDGNRVGEGDRVGNAVLRSITRDSVVLDWNGRQIKLPVR